VGRRSSPYDPTLSFHLLHTTAADTHHAKASAAKRLLSNRLVGHVPQKDLANNVMDQKQTSRELRGRRARSSTDQVNNRLKVPWRINSHTGLRFPPEVKVVSPRNQAIGEARPQTFPSFGQGWGEEPSSPRFSEHLPSPQLLRKGMGHSRATRSESNELPS
jgi:hypothetical protein